MDRPIGGASGGRRTRPTAHELARYEALFAARTRGMKSSAMREMMALTERPDVISLAGGLPDTSTFEPELYAKLMARVAADSTARALQYGPTEGMAATVACIVEVMAAEGTDVDPAEVIVTTGGQQVIDLVCKTLIDPGDVIVAEAPTYPGAVPTFSAYQAEVEQIEIDADGMPIDALEATLDRLQAEGRRPKFIYTIPNFQNPGGVTMSLARRRRLIEVARERELLVLEDNPYGLLRYEGEALPTLYSLDAEVAGAGGAADLVIYLGTFSKILSPGLRLGLGGRAAAGAREAEPRQTGRRPVLLAGHAALRRRVLRGARRRRAPALARLCRAAARSLPSPARRDARGARRALRRRGELDAPARRPVRLGDAERRHRHDRPARAGARQRGRRVRAGPRGVRRRTPRRELDAAELRGRAGGRHPRGDRADRRVRASRTRACSGR